MGIGDIWQLKAEPARSRRRCGRPTPAANTGAHPGPVHPATGSRSTLSLADSLILAVAERLHSPAVSRDRYWHWLEDKGLIAVPVRSF